MIPSSPPAPSRQGIWRTYSMADGLVGDRFEHIAEDADGMPEVRQTARQGYAGISGDGEKGVG